MESVLSLIIYLVGGVVGIIALYYLLGFVSIQEDEVGVVIKRYGPNLPDGRIVALKGEAGVQADTLPPGWYWLMWTWKYKIEKIPVIQIGQGQIALIVAEDGDAMPDKQILGSIIDCDDFQNGRKFLENKGQKGRQLGIIKTGIYRINTALFSVITVDNCSEYGLKPEQLQVVNIETNHVGVVTTQDGIPLPKGKIAGSTELKSHNSFQNPKEFLSVGGGFKGLQEEVLLSGSYNLNPWFVIVEEYKMVEIPIAHVGVVVASSGENEDDVSGDTFEHGNLVGKGGRGIWNEPLLPGMHALNPKIMKVEFVPTSNVVLNWANSTTAAHNLDNNLSSIKVRANDGFSFSLDVSQIIHVAAKDAAKVISRVGSMKNLVDNVLEPIIGNYFRNAAQATEILEFINTRSKKQSEAANYIKEALKAYNIVGVDTLIGDLVPPEELMKTLTDRKVAKEQQETFKTKQETEVRRQSYLKEQALAEQQLALVKAQQEVNIAESVANQSVKTAEGKVRTVKMEAEVAAEATKIKAAAEAEQIRLIAEAEAEKIRKTGMAQAEAYKAQVDAVGADNFARMEIYRDISQHNIKITPDVVVGGGSDGSSGGMSALLLSSMAQNFVDGKKASEAKIATPVKPNPSKT